MVLALPPALRPIPGLPINHDALRGLWVCAEATVEFKHGVKDSQERFPPQDLAVLRVRHPPPGRHVIHIREALYSTPDAWTVKVGSGARAYLGRDRRLRLTLTQGGQRIWDGVLRRWVWRGLPWPKGTTLVLKRSR
jgi:hypothetical protein